MSLPEHAHGHESAIKTPRQLLITVILAFLIPIAIIILLVNLVGTSIRTGAGSDSQSEEAIARRIQPVAGFKLVDADAPKVFKTGEQVFQSTCSACHGTGVAGAPKFGDKDAWAKYIKQGYEDLVKNAIHGIGAMPPKGGNASLDDFEVARAVVYMTNHSGASFDEPKEPAAGDAAQAEAAPPPRPKRHPPRRPPRRKLPRPPKPSRPRPSPRPRPKPRPMPATPSARSSTSRSASPATRSAWPARPSSATRPPGNPSSRRAWTPC
ncbi:putative cytochrome c [Castellaniella defragrans 65Phen]|uniref:Putative cytochrome c n=1 Tax=Castellaniella defragrans (strain DSM 12143 / CCUG 39792 / 65Phen) TaxID=1437824 RepID=W8X250_CASD6|nr:putative cytochrome c [Castellaniella defragrans 65Phen]